MVELTLQDINIIELETLQAGLDCVKYMLQFISVILCYWPKSHEGAYLATESLLVYDPVLFHICGIEAVDSKLGHDGYKQLQKVVSHSHFRGVRELRRTLVMMTSSSRGRLSFLMVFPSMTSERPFE